MKGHDFVNSLHLAGKPPKAVFIDFVGQPDDDPEYPVVVVEPKDRDFRWVRGLRVHVNGGDPDQVHSILQALKICAPARVIANYAPGLYWDSEVDA